ncbi:hypothetical protein THOM_2514, partial [Trachipleistophora hominis]
VIVDLKCMDDHTDYLVINHVLKEKKVLKTYKNTNLTDIFYLCVYTTYEVAILAKNIH